jgi:hypothetical protein
MEHEIKIEQAPFEPPLFGRFKIYIDGQYRGSAGTKQQAHRMAKETVRNLETADSQ